jgi:23S rRNA (cytosine1962-C5)-methyltransferase
MLLAGDWEDYELLDAGFGEKLERWGGYIVRRPEPQAVWPPDARGRAWDRADAVYRRSERGGGCWTQVRPMPARWSIRYKSLRFYAQLTPFKHTGIFPEQAVNWDWMTEQIGRGGPDGQAGGKPAMRVLNLFAYTGAATAAAASAGAVVCHVDAARGMVEKAKENARASQVPYARTRYIVDDVLKFVRREIRRGAQYDAVIMDPPAYGRGPEGELWRAGDNLYELVELCLSLLSHRPRFFLLNVYAANLSATVVGNILSLTLQKRFGGRTFCDEIGLRVSAQPIVLPCGCCGRWDCGDGS